MSATPVDEETQVTEQANEDYDEETQDIEDEILEQVSTGIDAKEVTFNTPVSKRVKLAPKDADREPGKSQFPISKVQKIIKADKEIPIVSKEATFLISLATEEFIKRFCQAGRQIAQNERRSTVQHKDLRTSPDWHSYIVGRVLIEEYRVVSVVRKADEFLFLEEIMQLNTADAPIKQSKAKGSVADKPAKTTMLDSFVGRRDEDDKGSEEDVIMNEDGTMHAAGHGGEDEY